MVASEAADVPSCKPASIPTPIIAPAIAILGSNFVIACSATTLLTPNAPASAIPAPIPPEITARII